MRKIGDLSVGELASSPAGVAYPAPRAGEVIRSLHKNLLFILI